MGRDVAAFDEAVARRTSALREVRTPAEMADRGDEGPRRLADLALEMERREAARRERELRGELDAANERVEDLEHENRGLRIALEEARAETARLVAEAERRGRHGALGEARKTVAGHTMPSILEGA